MNANPAKPAVSTVGIVLAVGLALLLVAGTWWLWPMALGIGGENAIENMVTQVRSWGPWAALGSVALMVVHSYAAALTEISWWTFIWATGLGILPLTILLNVAVFGWVVARRRSRARRGAPSGS